MAKAGKIDLEKALLDPGAVFASPEQVRDHPKLKRGDKIEILKRWAYDAAEQLVAAEEGMPGFGDDILRRIYLALGELGHGDHGGGRTPTKQGG